MRKLAGNWTKILLTLSTLATTAAIEVSSRLVPDGPG